MTYEHLDQLIRCGNHRDARRQIENFSRSSSISRTDRLKLAEFARRSGAYPLGIKLLAPYVRAKARIKYQPTASEKTEYAALLIRLGAINEAQMILGTIDEGDSCPNALFFSALAHIHRWEYGLAIPKLVHFISLTPTESYQSLVAQVNLAASLQQVEERQESNKILDRLRKRTESEGHKLLFANCLELSAQNAICDNNLIRATWFLNKAESLLVNPGRGRESVDALYIAKWRAILQLKQNRVSGRRALLRVAEQATKMQEWETVRDCDYHWATETQNSEVLQKLYFGTPFAFYRSKVVSRLKNIPKIFVYAPNGSGKVFLDLENSSLKTGQLLHRLLCTLASDLYRPRSTVELHSYLFKDRHFNPTTSPALVHQAVRRLRTWLKANFAGIYIKEHASKFSLFISEGTGLIYHAHPKTKLECQISRINTFPLKASQAAHLWNVSKRTAISSLNLACQQGLLIRKGGGKYTYYVSTN